MNCRLLIQKNTKVTMMTKHEPSYTNAVEFGQPGDLPPSDSEEEYESEEEEDLVPAAQIDRSGKLQCHQTWRTMMDYRISHQKQSRAHAIYIFNQSLTKKKKKR